MNVFTTINPNNNFEAQNEALSSWSLYYNIYSVNTEVEVKKIEHLYPYVKFLITDDTYDYNGKKLVKLNAILTAIKNINSKYSCIINSDIILKSDKLNQLVDDKYLSNGLIISTRYEIEGEKIINAFIAGYDIFIFDIRNVDILFNNNYVIGMPWWDYWVPLISLKYQLNVYHLDEEIFLHRVHNTNYDSDSWISFGEHLYRDIIVNLMNRVVNIDVYRFCQLVKMHIENKQINIKLK